MHNQYDAVPRENMLYAVEYDYRGTRPMSYNAALAYRDALGYGTIRAWAEM